MRTVIVRLFEPAAHPGQERTDGEPPPASRRRLRGLVEQPGGASITFDGDDALIVAVLELGLGVPAPDAVGPDSVDVVIDLTEEGSELTG